MRTADLQKCRSSTAAVLRRTAPSVFTRSLRAHPTTFMTPGNPTGQIPVAVRSRGPSNKGTKIVNLTAREVEKELRARSPPVHRVFRQHPCE